VHDISLAIYVKAQNAVGQYSFAPLYLQINYNSEYLFNLKFHLKYLSELSQLVENAASE
jgi:hypothetical protein